MTPAVRRYVSADEDSARWDAFEFRQGDVVISTRSKHGTTWMQTIVALLVFGSADLPAPLAELSPWLDWSGEPIDAVIARLEAQTHRRFVKTHTPLDGVPLDDRATYLVVARHPLDAAISLYHQGDNLDRERMAALTGSEAPGTERRPPVANWLRSWIGFEAESPDALDSLPGVLHHLADAWNRRHEPNVLLVHYDDLLADLDGEMRRISEVLDLTVDESRWPELAAAATFDAMRSRADLLAPDSLGVLKTRSAFFRSGRSGEALDLLDAPDLDSYQRRAAVGAPAELLTWLHR